VKSQAFAKGTARRGMDAVVQSLKPERMTAPDIPSIIKLNSAPSVGCSLKLALLLHDSDFLGILSHLN
jgi:hypothetical protein